MDYIISLVIVLGVLVFFHELGHFILARLCGVGVEKFSLGFGPRIVGKTIGRTDYRISAIPLGGYVKMVGEEPDAEIDPKDIPYSFTHKSVFKRFLIVAAGPLFNLFLAVAIFFCFFQIYGTYKLDPVVGAVSQGTPAEAAGVQVGDRIVAIGNTPVDEFEKMAALIAQSKGRPVHFTILRDNEKIGVDITPVKKTRKNDFGEDIQVWNIGIVSSGEHFTAIPLNPVQAFSESVGHTVELSRLMVVGIYKIITGDISAKTLGGPIMIAQMAGDQAKKGIPNLIQFIAFISINLAIVNFLPIPILDGGHLLFFLIEAVSRRPISIRMREITQQIGLVVLLMLMIFVFYNDFVRLFS